MKSAKGFFHNHGMKNGMKGRLMHWAAGKMTGEDAFGIMFGEKGAEFPAEMKREFTEIFDRTKESMKRICDDRKSFMEKWEGTIGEECFPSGDEGCHHGHPFGHGEAGHGGRGEGFPGGGRGFFGF